jgi:hypothetical protein
MYLFFLKKVYALDPTKTKKAINDLKYKEKEVEVMKKVLGIKTKAHKK